MTLSEIVSRVIELADKVYAYYDVELPKRHPNYPLVGPADEATPPPPEEKELKDFLSSLSAERISQLMLIKDFGYGRFPVDGLAEYFDEQLAGWSTHLELAVSQLVGRAALANELRRGLEELRKHKINVDKLPLKKAKARKR